MAGADGRPQQVRLAVLAVLVLALAYGLVREWRRDERPAGPAASSGPVGVAVRTGAPAPRGVSNAGTPAVPAVQLEALAAARPDLQGGDRDPFRFKPKPPAPVAPKGVAAPLDPNAPPPLPPPPPPIPLKFIGVLDMGAQGKVAVLSDGRGGPPAYGREGEIVVGQYRLLRIGAESVEMAYLDGRGRQVIRLSGQ